MTGLRGKVLAFAAVAMLGSVLTAGAADRRAVNILYCLDVLDVTQNAKLEFMKAEVAKINSTDKAVEVTLTVLDAQNSVAKQIAQVQTAILKKPDVIIFSAVDSVGSLPAVQAARKQGIPVVDARPSNPESPLYSVSFVGYSEDLYAAATSNWAKAWLTANPAKTLNVGLIYGAPAQTPQLSRENVVKDLAAQMPDRIKIVASDYGNWQTAKAQSLTQDWLLAHPEINWISAANDIMALGVVNALTVAKKQGQVMVSGYDLADDAIARIQKGTQHLDVGAPLSGQGQKLVDVAVDVVLGKFTDSVYTLTNVYGVTADNVKDYLKENPIKK